MAQVKLFGDLRQHTGQLAVTASGATIGALLEGLCASYPTLAQAILDGDQLRNHVRVMVNGHDIELADGLDTPVSETDQVAIFPPIAGGSLYHRSRAMPHCLQSGARSSGNIALFTKEPRHNLIQIAMLS